MTTDDPILPKGSIVQISGTSAYTPTTGIVVKSVKGRETARVIVSGAQRAISFFKKNLVVITPEEDPELFI